MKTYVVIVLKPNILKDKITGTLSIYGSSGYYHLEKENGEEYYYPIQNTILTTIKEDETE